MGLGTIARPVPTALSAVGASAPRAPVGRPASISERAVVTPGTAEAIPTAAGAYLPYLPSNSWAPAFPR